MLNSAVRLLDTAAERWRNKVGICDKDEELTFGEWRRQSMSVATELLKGEKKDYGVSPVIVLLPKSVRALVAFMGALYSGNPYVPVDYAIPMARLEKIVDNLRPGCVITDADGLSRLSCQLFGAQALNIEALTSAEPDEAAVSAAVGQVIDTDPIYIMYTSGSTGTPKGVTVAHRGVTDYAQWAVDTFGFDETTVLANQAPFYFDNSIYDIYGALLSGARLELIPEALVLFPSKLPEFLREKGVTSIFWVPTVMINVANSGALEGAELPELKTVAFCGEVMPNRQLNIWRRALPGRMYVNMYGPTEISDVCSYYVVDREFEDSDPLPIGKACENMRIIILNDKKRQAAPGEIGELCVIGTGVALGYWNAWDISDRVFVQNPINGSYFARLYRTGDLAYLSEEGLIMFIGRSDTQIKLKGNRIELGELENAAACVEGVARACAIFLSDREQIVLFIETDAEFTTRRFNMELKKYVPSYMLPGKLIIMRELPHTSNDKIDRVTLRKRLEEGEL